MTDQRKLFEAAAVERLKESGFLEVEIRVECLARCNEGYQDEVINAGWHYWNAAIAATPSPQSKMTGLPIELIRIPHALETGKGMWRTCSGCHELNEGHPTGPYSSIMRCHLGGGCFECGGIGAIWDTTDYEDFGNFLAAEYMKGEPKVRIAFGLEAQGHIPAVEAALAEGADWQEIGRRIGWDGETARQYYERHLARAALTTEGQPDA